MSTKKRARGELPREETTRGGSERETEKTASERSIDFSCSNNYLFLEFTLYTSDLRVADIFSLLLDKELNDFNSVTQLKAYLFDFLLRSEYLEVEDMSYVNWVKRDVAEGKEPLDIDLSPIKKV